MTHVLEDAYGFKLRGIYAGIKDKEVNHVLHKVLKFSKEDIKAAYNIAPDKGNKCAQAMAVLGNYADNPCPYIDHWHRLLDTDFLHLKRGKINKMLINPKYEYQPFF